jgi:hypothetical protein
VWGVLHLSGSRMLGIVDTSGPKRSLGRAVKLAAIFSEFRKVRGLTESGRGGMLSSGRSQRTTGNNVDLRATDFRTIFGFWCLAAPPEGCMSDRADPSGPPTVRADPSPGRPHVVSGQPTGQDPRGFRSEGLQWAYLFCLNLFPPPPCAVYQTRQG